VYGDPALKSGLGGAQVTENDFISDSGGGTKSEQQHLLTSILLIMDDDLTESQVAEISKLPAGQT
jgi:hypothetical protein